MASRSHVCPNERRLRPIYDSLDNGNNRKAIQEADKVLRKQKEFHCAKALKALALLRLGRQEESSELLHDVHSKHPVEDSTLQAMTVCYREVHNGDAIADLYENARVLQPDSAEILSSLFMAYVRLGSHKKQHQTAMALHKLHPTNNPYYFWAIMSIVMQAQACTDANLARTMYLPLAERMAKKYIDEHKATAEAEVLLYLLVLELQDKWQEQIALLEGVLAVRKLTSELNFRSTRLADLYCKVGNWAKANMIYKSQLKLNTDNWQMWLKYLNTVFALMDSECETSDCERASHSLEGAMVFINNCIRNCQHSVLLRGPYLARMELIKMLHNKKPHLAHLAGPPDILFEQYFNLFSSKPCCSADLRMYVSLLTEDEQETLITKLTVLAELTTESGELVYAMDVKHMCRHVCVLQLMRIMGMIARMSDSELNQLAHDLVLRYRKGLRFGNDLPPTDVQPSSHYLLFAAHLLLDLWRRTGQENYIWQAVVQLELGVRRNSANVQLKLLLLRLYAEIGVIGPCLVLWNSLDLKHIMNDSLGYLVSNDVCRLGHLASAASMFDNMSQFYFTSHKEAMEHQLVSYKFGSFTKILEFDNFHRKLMRSIQYKIVSTEHRILHLILESNCHASTEQVLCSMLSDPVQGVRLDVSKIADLNDLTDNRDLTVMECWDPLPQVVQILEYKNASFKEEKAWLHFRNLILGILAAAVLSVKELRRSNTGGRDSPSQGCLVNGSSDTDVSMVTVVKDLLSRFTKHTEQCVKDFSVAMKYPIQGPTKTRMSLYLQGKHHQIFVSFVQCFLTAWDINCTIFDGLSANKDPVDDSLFGLLHSLVDGTTDNIVTVDGDNARVNVPCLEHIVISAETLSFATLLLGVCCQLLRPLKADWCKQSRKKKGHTVKQPAVFEKMAGLVQELQEVTKTVHQAATQIDPVFTCLDICGLSLYQPLTGVEEEYVCERSVWSEIEHSLQQSSHDLCNLLHNKLQYLLTCTL